jgi:L-histidine N-alpha-methyltransferase
LSAANRGAAGHPKTEAASLTLSARPFETRWIELGSDASQLELGEAVRDGLGGARKTLPSRFFYDEEGSRLFEEICELPEYYLTRAETEILAEIASDLARNLPEIRAIVELGSGSAVKTEYLLRAFEDDGRALCFAPIDVSRSALEESIERLERKHPKLEILPAIAEYDAGLAEIHALGREPKLTLWLGSSIGNLERPAAAAFLARVRETMVEGDRLLVGIDLRKDREILERAYDDSRGTTARFNLNLLRRINHELEANFDLAQFRHRVHFDEPSGSVQSFLESQCAQQVRVGGLDLEVSFDAGERIHTEDSHKYSLTEIDDLALEADLQLEKRYFDAKRLFTLNLLQPVG